MKTKKIRASFEIGLDVLAIVIHCHFSYCDKEFLPEKQEVLEAAELMLEQHGIDHLPEGIPQDQFQKALALAELIFPELK